MLYHNKHFKSMQKLCSQGEEEEKKIVHEFVYEFYYCRKFFARSDKNKGHIEIYAGIPGMVYNFNNQNLVTFGENLKHKGDLPMVVYLCYETTALTNNCLDPEQKEMFVVSCAMIVAFHPANQIIIELSFGHSFKN